MSTPVGPVPLERFEGLPGFELIQEGLSDISRGARTVASLLVTIGAPRLRQAGILVPESPIKSPELELYEFLSRTDSDSAHGRYNALVRRLVSFERALECAS